MIPTRWLIMVLVSLLFAPYAMAGDQPPQVNVVRVLPALDIQRLQYVLTHDRKQVFEEGMLLDARQKELFWGVYQRFEREKEQLDGKRLRLLGTYIEKFPTLTNDEALKIMKQSGQNQQAELELRQKYFKILSKKLTPVVAARFAQLDDIVGMTVRLAILGNVPLIGGPAMGTGPSAASEQPVADETAPNEGIPK
ncbi:MAG TPA: hypothetical protein VJ805_09220 [Nitrospiraceae bacterium]|nr:hypothetical protein [Nitrospiraceae bacterium]